MKTFYDITKNFAIVCIVYRIMKFSLTTYTDIYGELCIMELIVLCEKSAEKEANKVYTKSYVLVYPETKRKKETSKRQCYTCWSVKYI